MPAEAGVLRASEPLQLRESVPIIHPASFRKQEFQQFQKLHGLAHICWRSLKEKDTIDLAAVLL
jgi:hypothetical protein